MYLCQCRQHLPTEVNSTGDLFSGNMLSPLDKALMAENVFLQFITSAILFIKKNLTLRLIFPLFLLLFVFKFEKIPALLTNKSF